MNTIVIYNGDTGFTKQYAEWISGELGCSCISAARAKEQNLKSYDSVIYGGSLFANMIKGWDKFSKEGLPDPVLFAVGFSDDSPQLRTQIKEQNHLSSLPLFYMKGGLRLEQLGFIKRAMIKKITGQKQSIDCSDKKYIDELIDYVRSR